MAGPASGRTLLDSLEELLAELPSRLSGSRARLSGQALSALRSLTDELDLVTRDELDELELRVAQLEHRLRLLSSRTLRVRELSNGTAQAGNHAFPPAQSLHTASESAAFASYLRKRLTVAARNISAS